MKYLILFACIAYVIQASPEYEFAEEVAPIQHPREESILEVADSALPAHAAAQTGGWHDKHHDTEGIAAKVAEYMKSHLNNVLVSCGDLVSGHEITSVTVDSLHTQVVEGTEVFAKIVAHRKDGTDRSYEVDMRRQWRHTPHTGPSSAIQGAGADMPGNKWSLHTIKPNPCPNLIADGADPFDGLSEDQWQTKLGYIEPPRNTYIEQDVEITDEERAALPKEFSWKTSNFKDTGKPLDCAAYSGALNQGGCGSCWAFAASQVISARFCVQTAGKTNPRISPQWITSCGKPAGCQGGWLGLGMQAMQSKDWAANCGNKCPTGDSAPKFLKGAVDRKCDEYKGKDASQGMKCNGKNVKSGCFRYYSLPDTRYGKSNPYWQWHIGGNMCDTKHGKKCDLDKMKKEIMTNGPLFAAFTVMEDFGKYKSGVYTHKTGKKRGAHAVMAIGWGEENGTPYWLIQNSWGASWGDGGYFKIAAGVNEVGIDASMMAGYPFLKGLCKGDCVNGGFDKQCTCKCHDGWGGKACDKCIRKCKGPQFTGSLDSKKCQCGCKKGYQGGSCQLKITIPATVQSGKSFDIDYADSSVKGKLLMKKGDKISIFKKGSFVWNKIKGWDKTATDSVKLSGKANDKVKTTLYAPGEYKVLKLHWLGENEFHQDKGYSTTFTTLGTVTVAPCGSKCAKQPPTCKDLCSYCSYYKKYCPRAQYINLQFRDKKGNIHKSPLNKACAKSCEFCGPAAEAKKAKEVKTKMAKAAEEKKEAAKKKKEAAKRKEAAKKSEAKNKKEQATKKEKDQKNPRPAPRPRPAPTPAPRPAAKKPEGNCFDNERFAQPYSHVVYKYKMYPSRCAYFKEGLDRCNSFYIKTHCAKTCTGKGKDSSRFSRPSRGRVMKEESFPSKCDYFKERGECRSTYISRACSKTCTGSGSDKSYFKSPYKARVPIVEEKEDFASRCEYYKKKNLCRWVGRRYCKKTCDMCSAGFLETEDPSAVIPELEQQDLYATTGTEISNQIIPEEVPEF